MGRQPKSSALERKKPQPHKSPSKTHMPKSSKTRKTAVEKRKVSARNTRKAKIAKRDTVHADETVIQSCDLDGEITVAKSSRVKVYQLCSGKKWEEIGPGSLKISVNKKLLQQKKKITSKGKTTQGRVIFHDARNRNIRLNLALGASLSISQADGQNPKVLMFSAISQSGKLDAGTVQETFLVKEMHENPQPESLESFKAALREWNAKLT
mmetsp:Transcript_8470/g.12810  ORF Transcript_8470/g.12810 Transcript_8470/m.12810 type:complete len:210 (-) Transcript_8470:33-662(-)